MIGSILKIFTPNAHLLVIPSDTNLGTAVKGLCKAN